MKLICSKSNLLKSINISMKAVPSRTTMTILECILIDASSSQIKFISNDMELGIETITEGMILEKLRVDNQHMSSSFCVSVPEEPRTKTGNGIAGSLS